MFVSLGRILAGAWAFWPAKAGFSDIPSRGVVANNDRLAIFVLAV
jgi:hypothetical protein